MARTGGCHVILISGADAAGRIRGATELPHIVDSVFHVTKYDDEVQTNLFVVGAPDKNRFGRTGVELYWSHHDHGVECDSDYRLEDPEWCRAHALDVDGFPERQFPYMPLDIDDQTMNEIRSFEMMTTGVAVTGTDPREIMEQPVKKKKRWWQKAII